MGDDTYLKQVREIESGLGKFAFSSENVTAFTNSDDAMKLFEEQWRESEGRARLAGRTPFSLERDRILHSDEFRNQSDKYHTIFYGRYRTTRNYATHTMRVAQVARSVGSRLHLNTELIEAISLGIKVGSLPFIHRSKAEADNWVRETIQSLDVKSNKTGGGGEQLDFVDEAGNASPPNWIQELKDRKLADKVMMYVPWAAGPATSAAYTSGQQS